MGAPIARLDMPLPIPRGRGHAHAQSGQHIIVDKAAWCMASLSNGKPSAAGSWRSGVSEAVRGGSLGLPAPTMVGGSRTFGAGVLSLSSKEDRVEDSDSGEPSISMLRIEV